MNWLIKKGQGMWLNKQGLFQPVSIIYDLCHQQHPSIHHQGTSLSRHQAAQYVRGQK
jgi:hypothetical protein